jgi:autotransporter-associated beta strand protein
VPCPSDIGIRTGTAAPRRAVSRAALLGGVWLGALAVLPLDAAYGADATWNGPGSEWTTGTNWIPSTVPDNTATFTNAAPTSVTISNNASINFIDFSAATVTYSLTVQNQATFRINNGTNAGTTFAPNVTVNAGAQLEFVSGGESGSLSGAGTVIIDSGLVSLVGPTSTTFSGKITGSGSLELDGGSVTLTGTQNSIGGTLTLCPACTSTLRIDGGLFVVSGTTDAGGGTLTLVNGGTLVTSDLTIESILNLGLGGLVGSIVTPTITNNGQIVTNFTDVLTLAADISGSGTLSKAGPGTLILTGNNSFSGGTTVTGGLINFRAANNFGSGPIVLNGGGLQWASGTTTDISSRLAAFGSGGATFDTNGNNVTLASVLSGAGGLTKIGAGTLTLSAANTYAGGSTINAGVLAVASDANLGSSAGGLAFGGGTLQFLSGFTSSRAVTLNAGSGTFDTNGNAAALTGAISGSGGLTKIGTGTLTLGGSNTYSGATASNVGTLQAGAVNAFSPFSAFAIASGAALDLGGFNQSIGSLAGAGSVILGSARLTAGSDNTSTTFSGTLSGTGGLTKIGAGALTLAGNSTYSGATMINAGKLIVNGSIASSPVTVNAGGTLAGTGTVGATTIMSGGALAPGNSPGTITVQGNLAFQSGALYLVQVTPSLASSTSVTGTASLAGTVIASLSPGTFARSYRILSAAGRLGGTTFSALTTSNLPTNFAASLSYTPTDVVLNLAAVLGQGAGLSRNQQNVAGALNNFFNNGGTLPANFLPIFNLTGANLGNALTLLSGEAATGAQQVGFQMESQFLNLMLDPFVDGRGGIAGAPGPALGFAPERDEALPDDIALAYSRVFKEPRVPAPVYEPRWSAWGGAYGGSNRTSGDPAVVGSHDLSATTAGFAGGLDYRLSPNSVVGLALAGGGTGWSLSQGLGSGKSDAFQAGVYGATKYGPAYLAAAFAFTNHWMSTDRFAFAGDHLTASFNAQSYGGRIESGYRFVTWYGGVTPYAAIQAQSFHTPGYSETDTNNGGFGLSYNSRTGNDTRSELGTRFDRVLALYTNAVLSLRARVAWAHDWVSDPALAAVFQTLPGASFVVNGATPAKNSALASAGTELRIANGVTLLAKFDGEFASHSSTYAGTGTLRYSW